MLRASWPGYRRGTGQRFSHLLLPTLCIDSYPRNPKPTGACHHGFSFKSNGGRNYVSGWLLAPHARPREPPCAQNADASWQNMHVMNHEWWHTTFDDNTMNHITHVRLEHACLKMSENCFFLKFPPCRTYFGRTKFSLRLSRKRRSVFSQFFG